MDKKYKMKKEALLTALEIVKPGLASKEAIEQTTAFAFVKKRVVTYNDEISISHPLEGIDFTGAVQAEELYQLLKKIKPKKGEKESDLEIDVKITDHEILISAGRIKAGITLQSEVKLPLEEISKPGKWLPLPEGFLKSAQFVMGACSKSQSKPALMCVHVHEDGYAEGSDNYRIMRHQIKEPMPVKTFLIPASSVRALLTITPTQIAESSGWVHFKTEENTIISCRIFEDTYPDATKFLNVQGTEISFPKTISAILDRASIFSKNENNEEGEVHIQLDKNRIKIRSKSIAGWFEEEANVPYDGEPLEFEVTPSMLTNVLNESQTCIYSERLLKFEGENWVYIAANRSKK